MVKIKDNNTNGALKDVDRNDLIDIATKVIKVIGDIMKK